jgi:hypothetical protein
MGESRTVLTQLPTAPPAAAPAAATPPSVDAAPQSPGAPSPSVGVSRSSGVPPARPQRFEPAQLGFEPQPFVRWFHPFELARAGVRAMLAAMFGAYADKRELQAALHPRTNELELDYRREPGGAARAEIWVDFVADLGDGFNATYAVASQLGREKIELELPGGGSIETPRGAILIMGGDEVYPTASRLEYEQRTVGPYRAALPFVADEARAPHLFAVPGNHDWYDGLSAFLRQFAQQRWIGGWQTRQKRSYFVLRLPHGVWVWGIDIQLHADIDGPQLAYFDAAADRLEPGDRVILCTAEPSWVEVASGQREGYRNLWFIESKVFARRASVVLVLTGDSHHYARYVEQESGRQYITAGGGGAFLHGTHTLPLEIGLAGLGPDGSSGRLIRKTTFPSAEESLMQVRHVLGFSAKNRAFALLWAGIWLLFGWCSFSASVPPAGALAVCDTFLGELARVGPTRASLATLPYGPVTLAAAVLLAAALVIASRRSTRAASGRLAPAGVDHRRLALDLMLWLTLAVVPALVIGPEPLETLLGALARSPTALSLLLLVGAGSMVYVSHVSKLVRVAVGLAHAAVHVLTWLLISTCTASLLVSWADSQLEEGLLLQMQQLAVVSAWLIASASLAGLASATVFGVYLWYAGKYLPEQSNDVFSALGIEDFKNFVRLHIDEGGRIHVYPVGIRRVPRAWQLNPESSASAAFIVPAGGAVQELALIEAPIVLDPRAPAVERV